MLIVRVTSACELFDFMLLYVLLVYFYYTIYMFKLRNSDEVTERQNKACGIFWKVNKYVATCQQTWYRKFRTLDLKEHSGQSFFVRIFLKTSWQI